MKKARKIVSEMRILLGAQPEVEYNLGLMVFKSIQSCAFEYCVEYLAFDTESQSAG